MIDRETGTVWTHLDGKAVQGPLQGARMEMIPMPQMTWADWVVLHPETMVLSPDNRRAYLVLVEEESDIWMLEIGGQ